MIRPFIQLLRIQQWIKNLFVFLPLFFGKHLLDVALWIPCICVFLAFSFASSGIYCLNDICDAKIDKLHKEKCIRPIASGTISKKQAYNLLSICWFLSFACVLPFYYKKLEVMTISASIILLYLIINIAYCLNLKHCGIIDVFIIAMGFVLRVVMGGIVTQIDLSHWIVLMTFLLALFLAFAKRRDDVITYEDSGMKLRKNINHYNRLFINQALCIIASITMVCYIMYTVSDEVVNRIGSKYLYTTSVFVLAGLIRYLQVTVVDEKSGSPTKVLINDRFIHGCIVAWIFTFAYFLYF